MGAPEVRNTPIPVAESTRQNPHTTGSETLRADQEGLSFAGLAEVTQIQRLSPQTDVEGPSADIPSPQRGEREDRLPNSPEAPGDRNKKERQVALLQDHVSTLRRERDRREATLLDQHLHRVNTEHLQGDALEVLRDVTLEEYDQLLEREMRPTLEYFELIYEELIDTVPFGGRGGTELRLPGGL